MEHLDPPELTANMVTEDLLDLKEKTESQAIKENLVREAPLGLKGRKETLELPASLGPLESRDLSVSRVSLVNLETMARKEIEGCRVTQEPPVSLACRDLQANLAVLDHRANKETPAPLALRVTKVL